MKKYLLYILPLFLALAAGCSKNSPAPNIDYSTIIPSGNFLGTFTLIHKSSSTGKLDTGRAIITIAFTPSPSNYSVAGDTSKIQAPSHGSYTADGTLISFVDATVTKTTSPNTAKKHLSGSFFYTYDGSNLRIYGSSDTLSFNYQMAKY